MAEQRLIDATSLKVLFEHEYRHNKQFKQSSVWRAWQGAIQLLYDQPTIDPETLPIVQQLRKELVKATAERDEIASLSGKLIVLCEQPQEWRQKLFRRHRGHMIGDYMGSGYPFVDAFDKIYVDFVETASNEAYQAVRQAAEAALKGEENGEEKSEKDSL